MREIHLLTYSTKPRGGVVHTLALAEALVELGERVSVWTLGRGGDRGFFRSVDHRVGLHIVPLEEIDGETVGARVLRSVDQLARALSADPPAPDAVVHAQDCISANAVLAAGRRCLRTVHHIDHFTTPELIACHERAIREPEAHVCVSRAVAAELRADWGIDATVIANGVDAARFAAAAGPRAAADRAAWTDRLGRYVLTVGGIEPRKGTLDLLEAHARLRTPARLVIAGGETVFDHRDYRAAFVARAAELGTEPVVLGPVADPELPALVAAAAAFAFPSIHEGFGLAAMEALAARVPVVMADRPVLRETFAGTARFAVGPSALAQALDDVLAEPDPARRAAGDDLARRHTWRAAATAHLRWYASLGQASP